jgi:hypothetical protein
MQIEIWFVPSRAGLYWHFVDVVWVFRLCFFLSALNVGANMDFLASLEQSGFSTWIRESPSVWAYPTILFLHTVGLGFLVGASIVIDLRVLGFSPNMPLEPMRRFVPVMWFGFWVNAASGVVLLMIDATKMLVNPLFYIKIGFIALAVVSGRLIANRVFATPVDKTPIGATGRILAGASLFFWMGAITAGRLTAYLFSHPS